MELPEKIENAFVAYLQGFSTTDTPPASWPASMNASGQVRIFAGENNQDKDGQCVIVIADDATEEYPMFSGNYYSPVTVWLRTPVKVLTPDEIKNKNPESLDSHKAASAILDGAINGDGFAIVSAVNALGTDFTIMGGILDRKPVRQDTENFWASGWEFRLLAAGKKLT